MKRDIRILQVEDEVITAMMMERELKRLGYKMIQHVSTGEMAFETAMQNPPDIILMDIQLAGKIDGIEAASMIKSELNIPVVFISSYEDNDTRKRADQVEPLAYLAKPVKIDFLRSCFDAYFHGMS